MTITSTMNLILNSVCANNQDCALVKNKHLFDPSLFSITKLKFNFLQTKEKNYAMLLT